MDWDNIMPDLIHLHPVVVHFLIALLTVGIIFDILGVGLKKEDFLVVGKWNMFFGAASLIFVVVTGLMAEGAVEHSEEAHSVMTLHKRIGITVLVLFGSLAILRASKRGKPLSRFRTMFLVLSIIGVLFMTYGASLGGKLVYEYGLAVSSPSLEQGKRALEQHEESNESGKEHTHDSHVH